MEGRVMYQSSTPTVCVREGEWPIWCAMPQQERLRMLALERICRAIDAAPSRRARSSRGT